MIALSKLRRDAGESVEQVSRFLDHSSLAVTTTYLRRLEGQEDLGWSRMAVALGFWSAELALGGIEVAAIFPALPAAADSC